MEIKNYLKKVKNKISSIFQVDGAFSGKEKRRLEKLARYHPTSVCFFGKKINIVDAPTFLSSYNEIFKKEIYKFAPIKKDITIIDCGANIGLATIYFKKKFPDAQIVAFEPDPNIFNVLKNNVLALGYDDVICRNEAVSDKDAVLNFWLEGGHSGMIVSDDKNPAIISVKAIRLKSFLSSYKRISFLKIDIEGEEIHVIPDIAEELKMVDYLFLEYHSFINKEQYLEKLLDFITMADMRYYIKEATDKTHPFINREIFLGMDMLINIFCYRVK